MAPDRHMGLVFPLAKLLSVFRPRYGTSEITGVAGSSNLAFRLSASGELKIGRNLGNGQCGNTGKEGYFRG